MQKQINPFRIKLGEIIMKRRLFSIFAILLFVLSGCQKEPTSKYIQMKLQWKKIVWF